MINIRTFFRAIGLVPVTSTAIDSKGEMEVLDASGKLNYHNGTTASPAVTEAHTATLTNKTINADSNTITNIENADIKAAAGIEFSKLAALTASRLLVSDGSGNISVSAVTATEASALSGVDSNVQDQLDTKASITYVDDEIAALGTIGDVDGPGSSVDNTIPRFDGVSGKLLQTSGVTIADDDKLTSPGAIQGSAGLFGTLYADNIRTSTPGDAASIGVLVRKLFNSSEVEEIDWSSGVKITNSTASTVPYFDASKKLVSSAVTPTELGYLSGLSGALTTLLADKAPLASPALTGVPTTPTAAGGTNTTQIASTAFVAAAVAGATPTLSVESKSATFSAAVGKIYLCDGSGGAFSANLPAAASNTGGVIYIKKTDTSVNAITLDGNASETIDGATTTTLNTQNEELTIVSDGTNWQIVCRRIPSFWHQNYSFTYNNFGTIGAQSVWFRREGDSLRARGYATAGTTVAATGSINMPTGLTINSSKLGTGTNLTPLGMITAQQTASTAVFAAGVGLVPFYDGSDTAKFYVAYQTNGNYLKVNGSTIVASNQAMSFDVLIPVTGWNA